MPSGLPEGIRMPSIVALTRGKMLAVIGGSAGLDRERLRIEEERQKEEKIEAERRYAAMEEAERPQEDREREERLARRKTLWGATAPLREAKRKHDVAETEETREAFESGLRRCWEQPIKREEAIKREEGIKKEDEDENQQHQPVRCYFVGGRLSNLIGRGDVILLAVVSFYLV